MTKFYVSDMKRTLVVDKPNKQMAAIAFKEYFEAKCVTINEYVHVNEKGFLNNHPIDTNSVFYI